MMTNWTSRTDLQRCRVCRRKQLTRVLTCRARQKRLWLGRSSRSRRTNFSELFWLEIRERSGVDVMITIFCDFLQKMPFFSKTNVLIKSLHNLAWFRVKKRHFFLWFFCENILKIITSVPGLLTNGKLERLTRSVLKQYEFAPRGELGPRGRTLYPRRNANSFVHTLGRTIYCLEKRRGKQRVFTPRR
jgi:hypothetical protein